METSVQPQPPLPYPTWMLVVGIALLVAAIVLAVFARRLLRDGSRGKKADPSPEKPPTVVPYFDPFESKMRHVAQLDRLRQSYDMGQVDSRVAHEEISRVARSFAHEATGIDVRNYTLEELRRSPYPALAGLIEICYEPEFAESSSVDPRDSIERAKAVIWSWT